MYTLYNSKTVNCAQRTLIGSAKRVVSYSAVDKYLASRIGEMTQ